MNVRSGKTLATIVDDIINEAVKQTLYNRSLTEKDKQSAVVDSIDDSADDGSKHKQTSQVEDDTHSSKTMEYDVDALKSGEVSVDDIIDKLNSIRSGHSFRDEKVKSNMQQYTDSLTSAEKTALLAFLKGISQIVTGEVPGPEAIDPSSDPANVKMQKGAEPPKVKHIKPNVITTQSPKVKKTSSAEDTSAPVPITPTKK
jgi:hypothetical protein